MEYIKLKMCIRNENFLELQILVLLVIDSASFCCLSFIVRYIVFCTYNLYKNTFLPRCLFKFV